MPMPLNQLLPQAQSGTLIRELTLDSRKVRPGDLFLAVPGTSQDGRAHIADALAHGAAAVLMKLKARRRCQLGRAQSCCRCAGSPGSCRPLPGGFMASLAAAST